MGTVRAPVLLAVGLAWLWLSPPSEARPERIRPGHAYYSDVQVCGGGVCDLGEEKNYEEVYQSYRYYEAVYDEAERVVRFREYVRGEPVRTEEYRYDAEGRLVGRRGGPPGAGDGPAGARPPQGAADP